MENPGPEISLRELREAAGRLLDTVEQLFGASVRLQADEYEGRSLCDDVASIRELLGRHDRSEDAHLLWHDLDHLTGILQRISALAS